MTDKSDDPGRMYQNKELRNFYIHNTNVHAKSDEECEKDYIKLLHLMIFEMERLNALINRINRIEKTEEK